MLRCDCWRRKLPSSCCHSRALRSVNHHQQLNRPDRGGAANQLQQPAGHWRPALARRPGAGSRPHRAGASWHHAALCRRRGLLQVRAATDPWWPCRDDQGQQSRMSTQTEGAPNMLRQPDRRSPHTSMVPTSQCNSLTAPVCLLQDGHARRWEQHHTAKLHHPRRRCHPACQLPCTGGIHGDLHLLQLRLVSAAEINSFQVSFQLSDRRSVLCHGHPMGGAASLRQKSGLWAGPRARPRGPSLCAVRCVPLPCTCNLPCRQPGTACRLHEQSACMPSRAVDWPG